MGGARGRFGNDNVDQLPVHVAAGGEDELADQSGGNGRRVKVGSALEAVRGIGVQAVPLAAAPDRCADRTMQLPPEYFSFRR